MRNTGEIIVGLILVVFLTIAIATVISVAAFGVALKIYAVHSGSFMDNLAQEATGSVNIGAEVKGLEVKEPHGYEHFRVEHQRDLLEVSNE